MPISLCPECGTRIQEVFLFCPICGKKLRGEEKKEAEKRWITVIFTDIKGFTSLSEALDPEEVHRMVDYIFKELTDIIEKRGGYVDKYIGDAIMALFGAPKSYGDDAERAIYSALEMQEVLKKNGILARIGINSGFVLAGKIGKGREGDYTAIGDTVNTAQRIESVCEPGKIWVSENVYRELRDKFDFKPLGLFELKGKKEKVKLFEVTSPRKHEEEEFSFYNREKELSLLDFIYQDLDKGPFFVLITGEAGVGKTRLIREFIKRKKINSITLFPSPFSKEFLSEWQVLFQHAQKYFTTIADSVYYIRELIKEKGFEEAKTSLIYLLRRILEKVSEEFKVIVIEKLGFWDELSRRVISELILEIEKLPIIFLITERKREINLPQNEKLIKIDLYPLEEKEFEGFLEQVFTQKVKNKNIFYSRTRGNFSFFKTLLNSLEEEEIVKRKNGKWEIIKEIKEVDFPLSFLNLLQAWIDSLSEPAKTLLEIVTFVGDEVPLNVLKSIYEKKERLMFEIVLDEAIKKGVIKESENRKNIFRISFPEIREIVEERSLKEEKMEYNKLIADTLSEIDLENNFSHLIFKHYLKSGNLEKAKLYLEKAMEKSFENYNTTEFENYLEEYKNLSEEDEYLYYYLKILSLKKKSEEILREFNKIKSEKFKIKAFTLKSGALVELGRHEENIKEIEKIVEGIKDKIIKNELLLNLAVSYFYLGDLNKALNIYLKVLSEINFIRDKILLKVLNALAIIFNRFGNKDMAFNCYEIAIKKAAEFKDKNQIATIYLNLGYDYLNLKGDYEKAEECFNKSLRIRESLKDPIGIAGVYQGFAYLFMVRGNMEKSLQFYIKAREVFLEIKKMRDLYVTEQNIANILANKCLFREAEKYYLISLERMEKTLNPYDIVLGKLNYSTMLLSLKKLKESRQLLEEALLISEKINYGLAISYIYSNLAIIKFVNKEKNYEEFMEKAIFYAKGIIVHEEHITLRKARLLYFMGKYEDFKKLLLELEGRIKNLQDLKLKLEVMILKTFLLKEEEKEMHLLSLLKDTRETGNDRILLKILYLLKDIRKGTESLYYNFLNKVSINLSEEEKEGLIEMLLLI